MGPLEVWATSFAAVMQPEAAVEECEHRKWGGGGETSGPKRVLVADDDLFMRTMVSRVATSIGHVADTAEDGEEAWEALHAAHYDLLITDHSMPRLTGLKLILRLRAESPSPPCILISANLPLPKPILRRLMHPGDVIDKPFRRELLAEAMRGLLGGQDTAMGPV